MSDFDKILPKELKIFRIIKSILSSQNELVQHFIQDFCFVFVLHLLSLSLGKFIKIALLSTLWGLILAWILILFTRLTEYSQDQQKWQSFIITSSLAISVWRQSEKNYEYLAWIYYICLHFSPLKVSAFFLFPIN